MKLSDLNPFVSGPDRDGKPCRFKVPFRSWYADTIQDWLRACWSCFATTARHRFGLH